MSAKFDQEWLSQYRHVLERGWCSFGTVAADKYEGLASCRNEWLRLLDASRLRDNAMPKLLEHLDEHPPDEGFIFNEKYGYAHLASPVRRSRV
ncbi:hypothetical protein JQ575_07590 [Bradyrhizobium sp. JYMT SZCCT0428]|nr:hypothetical protein [Bradyrhizobium sp. JYMT SZCCT0428]MBR1150494.1 hypothetical protein [Bradyrhizobium sp. JYMT SZCCT0428]